MRPDSARDLLQVFLKLLSPIFLLPLQQILLWKQPESW